MSNIYRHTNDFDKTVILSKIEDLNDRLNEEKTKNPEERNPDKEFELMYARMIAGLKLNTGGIRLY